jgi:protein-S-isoprenylcysteine O-methyltransferase Ste14
MKLFTQAILKFLLGVFLVGGLIFLPAWTLDFWQGWLLMGILFIPMFVGGLFILCKNPALLAKRLDGKEKQKEQGLVVKLSGLMFLVGFILAGLNRRFGWYTLPIWVSVVGAVFFLVAYLLYAEVMRENAYLSRTIEVQEGQKVVDTGLYGIVRHPMYAVTLLLFLSMPIVLGSLYALAVFAVYPILIIVRIVYEEKFLEKELVGYTEYKKKVKYRLIPFIW